MGKLDDEGWSGFGGEHGKTRALHNISFLFFCQLISDYISLLVPPGINYVIILSRTVQGWLQTWRRVWHLETKSRRDKCSNELRSARPEVSIASPPCSLLLKWKNHDDWGSIPLDSGQREVNTTSWHLICPARECNEQMHRGDQFDLWTSIERVIMEWTVFSEAHCSAKCF